jgi:hypothetical protein
VNTKDIPCCGSVVVGNGLKLFDGQMLAGSQVRAASRAMRGLHTTVGRCAVRGQVDAPVAAARIQSREDGHRLCNLSCTPPRNPQRKTTKKMTTTRNYFLLAATLALSACADSAGVDEVYGSAEEEIPLTEVVNRAFLALDVPPECGASMTIDPGGHLVQAVVDDKGRLSQRRNNTSTMDLVGPRTFALPEAGKGPRHFDLWLPNEGSVVADALGADVSVQCLASTPDQLDPRPRTLRQLNAAVADASIDLDFVCGTSANGEHSYQVDTGGPRMTLSLISYDPLWIMTLDTLVSTVQGGPGREVWISMATNGDYDEFADLINEGSFTCL